ncbi:prenyltransferase [Pelotomaculum propionicicum]|uniref:1,4-dihydroxy-2-naphthoate octaprenyltransferase n=1 Tax=Pelotomaculum propionicicum TaxID=258475 RepID=A0A4Y7RR36_9FIRM|nr:prenyltransferase [Pelotomaculum propionicicum]TEB10727.1 1,4-dihydroxy-2-naphthoate octaprenyltransferase [Pelotomaculum propionicicum]
MNGFVLKPEVTGLIRILRIMPVIASTVGSFALGFGLALGAKGFAVFNLKHAALIFAAGLTLHSVTGHAYNELQDWRSGTDKLSPGILSGGAGVIEDGLLDERKLRLAALAGILLPLMASLYFNSLRGYYVLFFLLAGLWSSLAYSIPPFRLAYRPLMGEWLALFPGFLACTTGSFYILTGALNWQVVTAGTIHGLLTLGWIMQHHLPDIGADLMATPAKITTPAFVYKKWGPDAVRLVPAVYFFLAALAGAAGGFFFKTIFYLAIVPSLLCAYLSVTTDPFCVKSITIREKRMINISTCFALVMALLVGLGF